MEWQVIDAYGGNGVYGMVNPYDKTIYFMRMCDDGEFAAAKPEHAQLPDGYKLIEPPARMKRLVTK